MRCVLLCGLAVLLPFAVFGQERIAPDPEVEYRIGPEDVILIQVWGRQHLSGEVVVDPTGNAQLPILGVYPVGNRTPSDLSRELTDRYGILDPGITDVIVSVSAYKSRSVTVSGEVRAPGTYGFRSIPSLWEVLLGAGGMTPMADDSSVEILRTDPESGEIRILTVDLSRGLAGTDPATVPQPRSGDNINVPGLSADQPARERIRVLGAVRTPGTYQVRPETTLIDALAQSGGVLPEANLKEIVLTRTTESGVVSYKLNLDRYLERGAPNADLHLQSGDTVTVPSKLTMGNLLRAVPAFVSLVASITTLVILVDRR